MSSIYSLCDSSSSAGGSKSITNLSYPAHFFAQPAARLKRLRTGTGHRKKLHQIKVFDSISLKQLPSLQDLIKYPISI